MLTMSALVIAASSLRWWSISLVESLGFATGGICVWLVVREHVWNWPIGLANNILFAVLFWQSRLFADMTLQGVYAAIAVYGWWNWTLGHDIGSPLPITRTRSWEWAGLALAIPSATWGVYTMLLLAGGAAPFFDALTTVISLAAQYLLSRKRIENWILWIMVDIIYVPLYLSRGLPLTAALYAVFLVMCCMGLAQWRHRIHFDASVAGVD